MKKIDFIKYKNDVLVVPLGGTDEIGMNLYLYQHLGKWLIVDMGIGFAGGEIPGVDIVVPDIAFLDEISKNIEGLVVTHAHEDHIGALQYLLPRLNVPVYCTAFSNAVLKIKFAENGVSMSQVNVIEPNSKFKVGVFDLEFIGLTHSVPQMQGLVIHTNQGTIFHSGDWKLDTDPVVGDISQINRLKELGDKGVLAMLCDSTNIFSNGRSGSEGELRKSLENIISGYKKGLIVVTTFASNTARLQSLMHAAQKAGRRVILSGTSLWRMYRAAVECGYLQDVPEPLNPKHFGKYSKKELLVVATGCQGEELASIRKLADCIHPDMKLSKGDMVMFSSKIIPGNETRIFSMFGKFYKMGVEVFTEREHFVHVSGHPCRDELKDMYSFVRPQYAIPMHGEPMHTHEHCRFVKEQKLGKPIQIENGAVLLLSKSEAKIIGKVHTGCMAIDGNFIVDIESETIKMRRKMKDHGVVIITLIYGAGKLSSSVQILAPGVLDLISDKSLIDELKSRISEYLKSPVNSLKDAEAAIKNIARKFFKNEIGKDPQTYIQVIKVKI